MENGENMTSGRKRKLGECGGGVVGIQGEGTDEAIIDKDVKGRRRFLIGAGLESEVKVVGPWACYINRVGKPIAVVEGDATV